MSISGKPQVQSSLSHRVIKGSFWILALRITNRGLGVIRTIILARLLLPEHFGVVGIAMLTISVLETFSQPGLGAALVQKKGRIENYLDTAWTVSVIRCLLIFSILYIISPYVAQFFDSPEAKFVIPVLGISVIIAGFRNIGVINFQKELDFRRQYIYEFSITLANLAVAIPAAYILKSVWALVLGAMAGSIARFIMSYVLHPYRPRLRLEKKKFVDLLSFGKWVFGSSMLFFLITQGDDIFLGKMLGVAALGIYQMAYMISNLPTTEITRVISHVTFPAYSQLQDDPHRFSDAYLKVLQLICLITLPLAAGIFILSDIFTTIFLGSNWLPIIPIINVLVWAGLTRAILDTTVPVFNAAGKPKLHTKWQLIGFIILALSIYPLAIIWGIVGISCSVLLSNLISATGACYDARTILRFSALRFVNIITLPLINTFIMMLSIYLVRTRLHYSYLFIFIICVLIGSCIYTLMTLVCDKLLNTNTITIIKSSFNLLRAANN